MSPRRTRAATAELSVSTRSKARNVNHTNENVSKQTRQRKGKSSNVESKLEVNAEQSARNKSNTKKISKKSVKKKTSRRKLNLSLEVGAKDNVTVQNDSSIDSNESVRILKDSRNNSVSMMEPVKNNFSQSSAQTFPDIDKISDRKSWRKDSVAVVNIMPIIVTPKSTPLKLNLTPHRSKKTPKKSPISLGSPKTHSLTVPRLLKSPRKLSLGVASEEDLDKLNSSHSKVSRKVKKDYSSNTSTSDKSSLTPLKVKYKRSDIHLKDIKRKFSKSPKIVLRSPKSKKSKSRKLQLLSPSRIKKSPSKISSSDATSNLNVIKSPKISARESPLFKGKNLSTIKRRLLNSKLTKAITVLQMKDLLMEPIVLLEKLSSENVQKAVSKIRSNGLIKTESPLISPRNSSKILTPIVTRISAESIALAKLKSNNLERSANRISPRLKQNTSIQSKDRLSAPFMSSTPREEKTPLMVLNLSSNTSIVDNTSFNIRSRHRNQSNTRLSDIMDKSTIVENMSKSSLYNKDDNTSQFNLSNVRKRDVTHNGIVMEKKDRKDNTYELEQPQTQNLRQMIKKRSSTDANLNSESVAKRARVHFANVTSSRDSAYKTINKSIGSRSNVAHNISARKGINSAHNSRKVVTPKFSRNTLIPSFNARSKPRTNEVTPKTQLSGMQNTPKTFMSAEKKSEKKSSVKKIPNFGKIHEQMFAKSESLVDAKKRLETRHLTFIASKNPKVDVKKEEKKLLPTDTKDGTHNRFGFKLKKAEATHIVLKKQTVFSRQKKQHETRIMLQGIRTNRRFELQMKSRNLQA